MPSSDPYFGLKEKGIRAKSRHLTLLVWALLWLKKVRKFQRKGAARTCTRTVCVDWFEFVLGMDLPNPHGSGALAPNGGKGTAPRNSDPEQPASPLNVRVPTSPSSGSSQRQGLEGKGLFAGKGGGQGFGNGTVPFGPSAAFAQGNVPFGAGPTVTGFQGQGFGPCTQFGCGGCGTGFCGAYGQPCTGGGVGVAQANTVPVSSPCPQTDVSGRSDSFQRQFFQHGVFGGNPNVTDFQSSQQVPGVSVLQQQQQFRLLQHVSTGAFKSRLHSPSFMSQMSNEHSNSPDESKGDKMRLTVLSSLLEF